MMFIGFFEPETLGETLINEQDAITQVEEAKLLERICEHSATYFGY